MALTIYTLLQNRDNSGLLGTPLYCSLKLGGGGRCPPNAIVGGGRPPPPLWSPPPPQYSYRIYAELVPKSCSDTLIDSIAISGGGGGGSTGGVVAPPPPQLEHWGGGGGGHRRPPPPTLGYNTKGCLIYATYRDTAMTGHASTCKSNYSSYCVFASGMYV